MSWDVVGIQTIKPCWFWALASKKHARTLPDTSLQRSLKSATNRWSLVNGFRTACFPEVAVGLRVALGWGASRSCKGHKNTRDQGATKGNVCAMTVASGKFRAEVTL